MNIPVQKIVIECLRRDKPFIISDSPKLAIDHETDDGPLFAISSIQNQKAPGSGL
jgi:hypothetical protein